MYEVYREVFYGEPTIISFLTVFLDIFNLVFWPYFSYYYTTYKELQTRRSKAIFPEFLRQVMFMTKHLISLFLFVWMCSRLGTPFPPHLFWISTGFLGLFFLICSFFAFRKAAESVKLRKNVQKPTVAELVNERKLEIRAERLMVLGCFFLAVAYRYYVFMRSV